MRQHARPGRRRFATAALSLLAPGGRIRRCRVTTTNQALMLDSQAIKQRTVKGYAWARKRICLDTRYWLFLRDVVGRPQKPIHVELLDLLRCGAIRMSDR